MDWSLIFNASISSAIGFLAVVYALAAIGLNIQFGYAGLLSFGQAAFLACGSYGLATIVTTAGLPFWLGIVVGITSALLLALLMGIPTLRLRADYLAIVTIAASEIVRLLLASVRFRSVFGGSDGLQKFAAPFYSWNPFPTNANYKFGPVTMDSKTAWVSVVGWTLVVIFTILTWLLTRSPWGRILKGIREDEDAVRSLGKNVYWYKMQALLLGALVGAFGGFIYALGQAAVAPDSYSTNLTFFAYTMLILGGAARVMGPILGALIFWFLIQFTDVLLQNGVSNGIAPFSYLSADQASQVRFLFAGVVLMLLMIFRPQGILGDRKEIALDER
jgi:neutral amino acid transport system permease protein